MYAQELVPAVPLQLVAAAHASYRELHYAEPLVLWAYAW